MEQKLEEWYLQLELYRNKNPKSNAFYMVIAIQSSSTLPLLLIENAILLIDDQGDWLRTSPDISFYLLDKFVALFCSASTRIDDHLYSLLQVNVSHQKNAKLCRIPIATKVYVVLKSMIPIKASILDGMSALFY